MGNNIADTSRNSAITVQLPVLKTVLEAQTGQPVPVVKAFAAACEGGGGGKPTFAQAGGKAGHLLADALIQFVLV